MSFHIADPWRLACNLAPYDPEAGEAQQREFLEHLHRTLNAPDSKIRNRLIRLTADSPDLLAIGLAAVSNARRNMLRKMADNPELKKRVQDPGDRRSSVVPQPFLTTRTETTRPRPK